MPWLVLLFQCYSLKINLLYMYSERIEVHLPCYIGMGRGRILESTKHVAFLSHTSIVVVAY